MGCDEFYEEMMDRYFDNELTAEEIKNFREHLMACDSCSASFRSYKKAISFQKTKSSFTSSMIGKDKFIKKIRRRKALPMQIAVGFAAITLSFFGTKAYMDFKNIDMRYRMIVDKSVEMMVSSASSEKPVLKGINTASAERENETEKIIKLVNDEE